MPFLLGSGSQCDVCLESFGDEERAPCSIECGHVFCLKCLNTLTRFKCPLCRQPFDPRSLVRLHIDVDEVRSPSKAQDRPGDSEVDAEARKFQERIAAAANEGTTEQGVRLLIDECKAFLNQQPRNNFSDLRVSLRMIKYVYEIKTKVLEQRQELKRVTSESQEEKAKLQEMVKTLERDMQKDRENWQALEDNLRDYCSKAQGAYLGVAELYLKAENERTMLRDTLRQLGYNAPYTLPLESRLPADTVANMETVVPPPPLPLPSASLFSPIPDFSDADLPETTIMPSITLLSEGDTGPEKKIGPIPTFARCGMVGCPFSCSCRSIDLFDDPSRLLSSVTHVASHATGGQFSMKGMSPQPGPSSVPGPSGISLTVPPPDGYYLKPASHYRVPTRPTTPVEGETDSTRSRSIPVPPARMQSYPLVNTRIYDLASSESAHSSSSLPNLSTSGSHFPSSLSVKHPDDVLSKSRSGSPYRSSSSRLPRVDLTMSQVPAKDADSRLSSGSQPRSTATSRASEAAKALEKQLKEQRRERERSQYREKERTSAGDVDSSRERRTKDRESPKSPEAAVVESSRARSKSVLHDEVSGSGSGSGSTRSNKASRYDAMSPTSSSMHSPPVVSPTLSKTPTNIYGPAAPVTTTTWTYAQSQSYHSSIGTSKGKMVAPSMKPTATLAS